MKLSDIKNPNNIDLTKLSEQLDILQLSIKDLVNRVSQINEEWEPAVGYGSDEMSSVINLLDNASKQFEAAKRGLGLANKLSGADKRQHASKVLTIMNRIRGVIREAEGRIIELLKQ